jgi:trans-aconitate 2-methyltransferase
MAGCSSTDATAAIAMADWDASLYLTFEEERTRPARDLLARVPLRSAARVVDLGCGPGNSTELLVQRFPAAAVVGVDTSEDMLQAARRRLSSTTFVKADIASWEPDEPLDLLFGNAVLQWLPDHGRLLARLMTFLAPGGVLAVQMPDNLDEPSHALMRATAAEGPWASRLAGAATVRERLLPAGGYYDALAPHAESVDVWRTEYQHPLADAAAIATWLRGTGLKPFLDALDERERASFLAAYTAKIAAAYKPRVDGKVLLGFPRLFVLARR